MKKLMHLVLVSILGGVVALGGYKLFFENHQETEPAAVFSQTQQQDDLMPKKSSTPLTTTASFTGQNLANTVPNFEKAAAKTVPAVVHIKNMKLIPQTFSEYFRHIKRKQVLRGMGSGVIITPDGYIVTNNHVIEGASSLKVTLNNNLTYKAKVVGADPADDIALLKIDAKNLPYLPFGDSEDVKVGQWVLAVGNPYTLTSTVTAGIISAKGRNLQAGGHHMESYLQTDAAINPGNSGGALVNTKGQLIGINSAITSRTGSFIGYSFAIPSNNAQKIVEDLMEYGNVKKALLGITGMNINPQKAKKYDFPVSQGVRVLSSKSGAKKAGLQKGDLITKINDVRVRKMADLTSYLVSKRPGDVVQINYLRNGKERITKVKLSEFKTYAIKVADLEVTNADEEYLKAFGTQNGVRIVRTLSPDFSLPENHFVIVEINGQPVHNIDEVKKIMKNSRSSHTRITFQNRRGRQETVVF